MNALSYILYGNPEKDRPDLLIFVPHSGIDPSWIHKVQATWRGPSACSQDLLIDYMIHEADIGARDIALASLDTFFETPEHQSLQLAFLELHVPRAFCDMNRPWIKACPPILQEASWKNIYSTTLEESFRHIRGAHFCCQLHTMCSYALAGDWILDDTCSSQRIREHIAHGYSGMPREHNILTKTREGIQVTDSIFDGSLRKIFGENRIPLDENIAYQQENGYPCTDIAHMVPSSFLEITKGSLATDETAQCFDTTKIILDEKKIRFYGGLLADAYADFFRHSDAIR